MQELVGTGDSAKIRAFTRELRQFLGSWYLYLSGECVESHRWECVPGWAKRVPSMLDQGWILFELTDFVADGARVQYLRTVLDQVSGWSASGDVVEGILPSIDTVVSMFEELFGAEE